MPPKEIRPHFARNAFTLIELLVVVAILGILAALLLPTINNSMVRAAVAKSTGNLREIGAAVGIYAGDNNGLIPGSRTNPTTDPELSVNNSNDWAGGGAGWWQMDLAPYLGSTVSNPGLGAVGDMPVFADPVFLKICGLREKKYFGGYAMNRRMGFSAYAELKRAPNPTQAVRSDNTRTRLSRYEITKTIFLGPGYYNEFLPQPDGTVNPERFSDSKSTNVRHGLRIGMKSDGIGGRSALYLFLDGGVRELVPGEANSEDPSTAAFYLKRRG